ncbi:MAG TPA: LysR family transcriptional regulator [Candidatus Binatia bacterium]|jgi:DNA-binding transcriptional LysR family regulator|nr:LysR family transcriptional regulator [Candidatus Binatia bacterium]
MTLRQLEVFMAVARERSFSAAARRIHLSQPTLSEHVRELERELGAALFSRRGRAVALTDAGRVFEPYAVRVLATVGDARQAVAEVDGLHRGSLAIGASTTPGIYVLPRVIGALRRRHPGIAVSLRIANSRVIEEGLRANEFDLGVVGGHGLAPGEECLTAGLLDELVLVMPSDHPWAGRRVIAPDRLNGQPLLMREEGSATRQVTERALQRANVRFTVAMELDHPEAIKEAVMAGLGLAFMSVHAVRRELAAGWLRTVRLRGLRIHRHFHVIHHEARTLGAGARVFLDLLDRAGSEGARPRSPSG